MSSPSRHVLRGMGTPLRAAIRASAALLALGAFSLPRLLIQSATNPPPPLSIEHLLNVPRVHRPSGAVSKARSSSSNSATWCRRPASPAFLI